MNKDSEQSNKQRPPCSAYWRLFKHMSDNHGLTLLDSEMEDICRVVNGMRSPMPLETLCIKMLKRMVRRKYTRTAKYSSGYSVYLQIDLQGFCVVEDTTLKRANWYRDRLASALSRLLSSNDTDV